MLNVASLTIHRAGRPVLEDITFDLTEGKRLFVLGESGAGKSTLIGGVLGLVPCAAGRVTWNGAPLARGTAALVMQEPRAAFNPSMTLRQSVAEPLRAKGLPLDETRLSRLCDGLELPVSLLGRRPRDVSIGQAQRVAILRALIGWAKLVLFDEPLSALDAATQKHTARLIATLQKEEGFAAMVVTHDLGYAAAHADDVILLRSGRQVEAAPAQSFFLESRSDYGRALIASAVTLGSLERAAA
jgi:peptide/nickel transport system ATP-binding protein